MTLELDENKVWVDGCFDFMHHGHCGALLQARRTAPNPSKSQLLVGIHTDEQITINKGPPVMHTLERYSHSEGLRWCTKVVEDAPYVTHPAWLDRYGCKYVVHGDDITTDANGDDCYQEMKDLGRFKVVKRTYGVSTTDIIQRILTGKNHHEKHKQEDMYRPTVEELTFYSRAEDGFGNHCFVWDKTFDNCLVEGSSISNTKPAVLVLGEFDLFHMGHIEQLANIHKLNPECRIIVGLSEPKQEHKDSIDDGCIMTLKERALSILSCRYVDGLILTPFNSVESSIDFKLITHIDDPDFISEKGSFSEYLTKKLIISRIQEQRDLYVARNKSKGMLIA
ncbi:ethanolamine-phosphate cytidylyltransferase [Monosporozyma servazzii]